jgi:hypothetical protein
MGNDDLPAGRGFQSIIKASDKRDEQIDELQQQLTAEKDARREDRFVFIVVVVVLLDIVFFSVMPTFGGPIALLILQVLILVPLARRMGMEEVAQLLSRVLDRMADKSKGSG